jgi:Zn-dependent protease with chaperone function
MGLKTIGSTAYWSALKVLRFAHYKEAVKLPFGLICGQLIKNSWSPKPLQEISQDVSFKNAAPQILELTRKLGLTPESIQFSYGCKKMCCTFQTMEGHLLILSEELFKVIPNISKIALVGHELVHMKDNYSTKDLCAAWIIPLSLDIASSIFPKYLKKVSAEHSLITNVGLAICYNIITSFALSRFGRHFEKRADMISAQKGDCAIGLISIFTKIKEMYEQELKDKSILAHARFKINEFFDNHPSWTERIKYLTPIAEAQATVLAEKSH